MTRLTIENLTKRYRGQTDAAVENLNLVVETGSLTALLGPSGCGKTTTMKMIAGLLEPTEGDIRFDGQSILGIAPEKRGAVMVFQNYLLFPYMSVGQNVGFGLKMRRVDRGVIEKRVGEILELVRLPGLADRRPSELSGGQQQRVALARALIVQPKMLLLDEPLSNLDAHLRFEMRDLIREIQHEMGITTVFVTHDQEEAVVLADRIALIFDGRLQQYDEPTAFYERPRSRRIATFFGGINFFPGRTSGGSFDCPLGRFHMPSRGVAEGEGILSIRPEDVRIAAVGEKNTVTGRIASQVYMGTHSRLKVGVGDHAVHVVAAAETAKTYAEGDEIGLQFPSEKLWVLPPEPGGEPD
ncbi:MAG: ABC transporter ATP-binding protein [Inquilinaceae bacterium]